MGVNVCLQTLTGEDHSEWDDGRYSGDERLVYILGDLDMEVHVVDPGYDRGNYRYSRPRDFAAFRAANWPDVNEERWKLLADLLERDSEYWIYFSF